MEAANRGALRGEARSIGLNIKLPLEQKPNEFTTTTLTFRYFFVRKVMLVKYASAFIFMPGGLGTMDELTEVLTLIQTHKIKPFPAILVDSAYWKGLLDWMRNTILAQGFISRRRPQSAARLRHGGRGGGSRGHVAAQAHAGRQESRQPVNKDEPPTGRGMPRPYKGVVIPHDCFVSRSHRHSSR